MPLQTREREVVRSKGPEKQRSRGAEQPSDQQPQRDPARQGGRRQGRLNIPGSSAGNANVADPSGGWRLNPVAAARRGHLSFR